MQTLARQQTQLVAANAIVGHLEPRTRVSKTFLIDDDNDDNERELIQRVVINLSLIHI